MKTSPHLRCLHHRVIRLALLAGLAAFCLPVEAGSSREKRALRALKKSVRQVRMDLAKVSTEVQNVPTAPAYGGNPLVLAGKTTSVEINGSPTTYGNYIEFEKDFPSAPVVIATVDETINQNGAAWVRQERTARANEVAFTTNLSADRVHWFAIEPGVHQVSGKTVQAGRDTSGSFPANVTFPQPFSTAPVVFLMMDASDRPIGSSEPTWIRINASVTANGFTAYPAGLAYKFQWIAMEPGTYEHGRFKWVAGVHDNSGSGPQATVNLPAGFNMTDRNPGGIVTMFDTNGSGANWIRLTELAPQSAVIRLSGSGAELINYLFFFEEK